MRNSSPSLIHRQFRMASSPPGSSLAPWRAGVLALGLGLSLSCGRTGVEEEDFESQFVQANCDSVAECCGIPADEFECPGFLDKWYFPPEGAKTEYDPEAADRCLQDVAQGACGEVEWERDHPCDRVYSGTVPDGGACTSSADCAAPSPGVAYCEFTSTESELEGEPGFCRQVRHRTEGQSCGVHKCEEDGVSLCNDGPCAAELFCNTDRKCQALVAEGDSCDTPLACRQGLLCEDGICAAQPTSPPCEGDDCPRSLLCNGF